MNQLKCSDDMLYQQFLLGDTASYDQLMIRYGDALVLYLHGYLQDFQEAEDLMIEAFARIMVRRPSIGAGAFKAYLFRTGRNLATSFFRSKSRRREFSLDGMEQEAADYILTTKGAQGEGKAGGGSPNESTVETKVEEEERRQILHLCLDRIEPELREALWLIYFEDMTYAQAASVLGVKEKRISRLLARGKDQMRRELKKEGITDAHG